MGQFGSTATVEFMPPGRLPVPAFETADIVVAAPPEVTRPAQTNLMIRFIPVVAAIATVGTMAVVFYSRSAMARNPAFMMFPLVMLLSAVATVFSGADRRRGEINAERAEYLVYLSDLRAAAVKTTAAQQSSLIWCHPDPDTLWTLVGGCRMWERRAADPDFCHVRIGIGTQRLATRLVAPPIGSVRRLDPVTVTALHRFLQTHSTIPDAPVVIALPGLAAVTVGGDPTRARALLRATICQLAVMHSPSLVLIAAAISDRNRSDWDWLKWLPHNRHPHVKDHLGSARMVYPSLAAAEKALAGLLVDEGPAGLPAARPHLVVVVDGDVVGSSGWAMVSASDGVTLLTIQSRGDDPAIAGVLRLRVSEDAPATVLSGDGDLSARPDRMSYTAALACAQRLAGYRAGGPDALAARGGMGWQDLVGIGDVASYTPPDRWNGRGSRDRLRVPIGTTVAGAPLELDIKEAAEKGMGPHGLCIGATGSGKSEFLRTVALGHDGLSFTGGTQPGPNRLQGWCDLLRIGARAARRSCHHEPVGQGGTGHTNA